MAETRLSTFQGIVMYQREHKERDLLVKILTREFGKKMFFVKNGKSKKNRLTAELQPLMQATYEGTINFNGLSFIDDVKAIHLARSFMEDIELNAYGTYLLGLIDSAFVDNQPLTTWFDLAQLGLEKIEHGFDPQGIANYFELALLPAFGLEMNWSQCAICGRSDLPLDFSDQYHGVLCQNHFQVDDQRWQIDPKAMLVLSKFSQISLNQLGSLKLKAKTKQEMARLMNHIYDDQVGIHLKSKTFIQQLDNWQDRLGRRQTSTLEKGKQNDD
ncbi:DNA repair protein RecO [Weissella coleopterorum]|uniref:DNA repair protein RecO n=1 Tax=Weissella coleopterorum TaxID=2714949 RepID=A0A6G8B132_9LACO|nr:DNA repair protein RecO [Weissella coleopterorum]QIL50925.1 DNA repair protein RecO [Weissella coleopterorum]